MRSLGELLPHVGIYGRLREMHGFRPLTDLERNDGALQFNISTDSLAGLVRMPTYPREPLVIKLVQSG